jgi:hypothetical protein
LAEWESCAEPCRFNLHTFAGEIRTFALQYESSTSGRHWWVGTVPQASDSFQFAFNKRAPNHFLFLSPKLFLLG